MTIAERIADRARQEGLELYFGLPGSGALMDLMEAGRHVGLDLVLMGHESSAAITAAYYGYLRGGAGLAIGIKGAGAGNLAAGAVNAFFERMPVVCLCERMGSGARADMSQVCVQEPLFAPVSNATLEIDAAGDPGRTIDAAFAAATAGRPGPALLQWPSDQTQADAGSGPTGRPEPRLGGPAPDGAAIARAARLVGGWRRPAVILGPDIALAGASGAVRALIDRMRPAVLHGFHARGMIPEDDPRFAGVFMAFPGPNILANRILAEADGALLIGVDGLSVEGRWDTALGVPTCELAARPDFEIVSPAAVRVDGDLAASLPALTAALPAQTGEGFPTERVAAIRADILARCFARPPDARLAAQDAVQIARELLPEDGIMVSETGVFIVMLDHLWPVTRPDTFFGSGGGRTMGLTVPAALGAKLARPETPVLGIGGDGSLLMRLGELETFARTGAAVPLVIINDQAHGTIRSRQKTRGLDPYSLQFAPVDYAAIARASGLRGATVYDPETLRRELAAALAADVATLIDVRVDPQPYQDSFGPTIGVLS